ncbi:hypothetical protein AXF42_Ash020507 [Apostasia shenzhenica]|uniref:Uncharacterized protein n=1 Tax=Apostasia shenzhenica TaxID=1088818 RepID=A0A2H9ZY18_9ASPA|nr:hypothetical protein AXF42_Ash020507 [Apostasia shenzhenica]
MARDADNLPLEGERRSSMDSGASLLQPFKTDLDRSLRRFELFLSLLGFHPHSSVVIILLSATAFLALGIAAPVSTIVLTRCPLGGCEGYRIERFEVTVLVFEALLAAFSLACISRNLFKYDIRKFLFVDQHHGQMDRFHKEYVRKIQSFFQLLLWWILPCFLVKIVREIIRFENISSSSSWKAIVVFLLSIASWIYLIPIFLSSCLLFYLVCNLQVIHFEDYGRLFERDLDTMVLLEEHVRLRYCLSKISHRFRGFLLSMFLFVTASQFVVLIQITGFNERLSFTNAGDLAIASVVQVVGIVLCLHSAAKMSHRAQGIGSLVSKWHALRTCASDDTSQGRSNSYGNLECLPASQMIEYSESDLESVENNITVHASSQPVSCTSSYQKRQALVMYLHSNAGGITIYGWTIDRMLLNTIVFLEISLVLFVLGKTLVITSK